MKGGLEAGGRDACITTHNVVKEGIMNEHVLILTEVGWRVGENKEAGAEGWGKISMMINPPTPPQVTPTYSTTHPPTPPSHPPGSAPCVSDSSSFPAQSDRC